MRRDPIVLALPCRRASFEPRIAHEALEMASALSLFAAGISVALVPASIRRDKPLSELVARFLEIVAALRP